MTPVYAAIGHQDGWPRLSELLHILRGDRSEVAMDEVRAIIPWIPPRVAGRFTVHSTQGVAVPSVYVESFLTPDDLGRWADPAVIQRIQGAIRAAKREGAKIVALGGFTSILAEFGGGFDSADKGLAITTGNSLTAALIVEGVHQALQQTGKGSLDRQTIMIVGASGDIGSALARWFDGRCARLLLCARHRPRLSRLQNSLRGKSDIVEPIEAGLKEADVVISVASMAEPQVDPRLCRADAIICDAGYPKNMLSGLGRRCFWGGLGLIGGGLEAGDPLFDAVNPNSDPNVAHGCLLEGAVLAMAGRFEDYSKGRGKITPDRIDEIWSLATAHGVCLAPLRDAAGRWDDPRLVGAA